MRFVRVIILTFISVGCCPLEGCATELGKEKVAQEVLEKSLKGERLDLIVEFDDSTIRVEASQLNKAKGFLFDENETIRFKAERLAIVKQSALSTLPSLDFEVLKNYETLPLMLVRFRTTTALKALLGQPSVINVYEDRKENLIRQE